MSRFFSYKYSSLEPYVPGEQPRDMKYVKLNTNESPFPPSPKAIEYASKAAEELMLYPDPDCKNLHAAYAKAVGVKPSQVLASNGSDEILYIAFMAFCDDKCPAVYADITYGFYKVYAEINNLPSTVIPLKDDFSIDVEAFIKAKGTIFLANPNAQTGIELDRENIIRIIESDKNRVVVVDEAYVDFGGTSCVDLIDKYDNLMVIQTTSKSRSMAGARLGFAIANEALIQDLNTLKYSINPYNINRMTMAAAIGSLEDDEYNMANCKTIIKNREYTTAELNKLGFDVLKSSSNYVFAKSNTISGNDLYLKLKERGVLIRHFNEERIKDYNRITIGTMQQMEILLAKIKEILEECK